MRRCAEGVGAVTVTEINYDPYDVEVDNDPYPVWKRMRDEAPLYYNEKHDFYALTRFEDVDAGLSDWRTYISGKGTLLEIIKGGVQLPPGNILWEDPPSHDLHRAVLSKVFRPRDIAALEPKIRAYCAEVLDPIADAGGFDYVNDLARWMPMRVIGELLGIPEDQQEGLRDAIDASLSASADGTSPVPESMLEIGAQMQMFGDYIEWRRNNPSDDLMTELLNAEITEDGVSRKLTSAEIMGYAVLLAGAGNETTARLIGWTGKVLAEHPDQRQLIVDDRSLIPNAIEEVLRFEAPSPVQARYATKDVEWHGQLVAEGSVLLLLNGSANRDERHFGADADRFDVRRKIDRHVTFGYGLHFCMGAALARMEARVALEEVLARFSHWDVDYANAKQARTSSVRGWERLPVITS
jgi:cytochrome P450